MESKHLVAPASPLHSLGGGEGAIHRGFQLGIFATIFFVPQFQLRNVQSTTVCTRVVPWCILTHVVHRWLCVFPGLVFCQKGSGHTMFPLPLLLGGSSLWWSVVTPSCRLFALCSISVELRPPPHIWLAFLHGSVLGRTHLRELARGAPFEKQRRLL